MPDPLTITVSCAFGLESVVKRELTGLGLEPRVDSPGRIDTRGDTGSIARANLWLRSASRVGVLVGEGPAGDFDGLFELVRSVDWPALLPRDAEAVVRVRSRRSRINSPKSAQSVVKRAIVDAMVGRGERMGETGPRLGVEVSVLNDRASIVLDTSGEGLHRRGYRVRSLPGQLKENLAAAVVQMTGWRGDRPLIDPFCGRGTIVIEAAMIAAGIAPGWKRTFAGERLPWIDASHWAEAREGAHPGELPTGLPQMLGRDVDPASIGDARRSAEAAGVTGIVGFRVEDFAAITRPAEKGWVITNPPYGLRVLEEARAREIHARLPGVLSSLPGWSHAVLTALPGFEALIRQEASKRRKLYNGRVRCDLYVFRPRRADEGPTRAAFGDTSDRNEIAETFRATLRKRVRHLRRWLRRGIEAYRVYDAQTPGAALLIDRYGEHLHIAELERRDEHALGDQAAWLERLKAIASEETGVGPEMVHLKRRKRQRGAGQYERADGEPVRLVVNEHGLRYEVELATRLDTGLFLDHRPARRIVREWAEGRRVLNLFAYTGSFTVAAAAGGAASTATVDLSPVYLEWAGRNLALNDLAGPRHQLIEADAVRWLQSGAEGRRFDLIVVDPPTFSNSKRTPTVFDVQRDHDALLRMCWDALAPGGRILFSTNRRGFKIDRAIPARETTRRTVPEDFPHSKPHRSWVIDRDDSD